MRAAIAFAALALLAPRLVARDQAGADPSVLQDLRWRSLGPFRGGYATAVAGVASRPFVLYLGTADGGVWQTTDAGRTWQPLFDEQAVGSIGAIAVAPSNPQIVYAGTGARADRDRANRGGGIYRSADGGRTWTRLGLTSTQHIARIAVDPRDADRVLVAVLGSPSSADAERGVFRSIDGGRTFARVLSGGSDTGAADVVLDPSAASIAYASLWHVRRRPWDGEAVSGSESGVYKSTDEGVTWRRLDTPAAASGPFTGRLTLAVAPSDSTRVFALASGGPGAGLYVSTNGGERWTAAGGTAALGASEAGRVVAARDPSGRSILYVTGASVWRSTDLGGSFSRWIDDAGDARYEDLWINPQAESVAAVAGSRGALVTVNGGESWSEPDTQPFGEFSSVAIDTVYPFRACGSDPASGAGCLALRGDSGRVTRQDWRPIGPGDRGVVRPDPNDPDVLYSGGLSRHDRRTGQTQEVGPDIGERNGRPAPPVTFAPADTRALLVAGDVIWKSTTAGYTWTAISPPLAKDVDAGVGRVRSQVAALAPSPVDARTIWAGTDGGAVHVTRDGGTTWRDVTPAATQDWSRVAAIEPSHFDGNTAYVAVDRRRLGDAAPHVLRTRDGGTTWTDVGSSLPADATAYVVREDQFRRGLLFAGTARSVFVSFDDGDRWQPLRLNLPPTAVKDLAIRESTLVAATGGRGFWALDDLSVLRQITADIARASAFLFRPATAWRTGAVTPSERPAEPGSAPNPPTGAWIFYLIGASVSEPVTLEIIETATNDVIRRFSSADAPAALDGRPGLHHVVWDLRYTPIEGRAPMVVPGAYQVRLTAAGQPQRQAVLVRLDPRLRTPPTELAALLKLGRTIHAKRAELVAALERTADAERRGDLRRALDRLNLLFDVVQQADVRPTAAVDAAIAAAMEQAATVLAPLP